MADHKSLRLELFLTVILKMRPEHRADSRRSAHVLTFTKSPPCIIKSLITLPKNNEHIINAVIFAEVKADLDMLIQCL